MSKGGRNLIARRGLYCGDCHAYANRIPDLARALREELQASRYDLFAEAISQLPRFGLG